MENSILQNFDIFNMIYNKNGAEAKRHSASTFDEDPEKDDAVYRYPKSSRIERIRNSLKFKEENDPLFIKNQQYDDFLKKRHSDISDKEVEVKHLSLFNNLMF